MKKHTTKILTLTALLLFSTSAFSQFSEFGIKAGLNMSNLTVEGNNDNTMKFGLHAGILNKYYITEAFALQPELLYSSKGFENVFNNEIITDGEVNYNLNYIDLPIKLVFYLAEDFNFQFGPYIGYLINANVDVDSAELLDDFFQVDSREELDRDMFNTLDFGLTGGLEFELNPLLIGFNYNLGLTQVAKDDKPIELMLGDAKNTVIQVYAGVLF
ncbi:MAG: porin family protein [Prolixibacteraceae bacterium]